MHSWVKVCGLTRLSDALLALELGANALGFIFHPPSPRSAQPQQVREIVAALPPGALTVGVFVRQDAAEMNRLLEFCRLDRAQLHGGQDWEQIQRLRRPAWRVVSLVGEADLRAALDTADALLHVDAPPAVVPGAGLLPGGTGQQGNWELAAALAARRRVILAGGLNAENVAQAVARVAPWGVDVASGVERTPGVKDPQALRRFFGALRG